MIATRRNIAGLCICSYSDEETTRNAGEKDSKADVVECSQGKGLVYENTCHKKTD